MHSPYPKIGDDDDDEANDGKSNANIGHYTEDSGMEAALGDGINIL